MAVRPTQSSIFNLVSRGLQSNLTKLAHAQERVSSGKEILRPSDDAVGTARALSMRRRLGLLNRFRDSVDSGRPILETTTSALEEASGILSEARALVVQSMSGSMNPTDREAMGLQIELILEKLVDVANTKIGDRFVFSGTKTDQEPFNLTSTGGEATVEYLGNDSVQRISVGFGTDLAVNVPGSEVFGASAVSEVTLSGLTGASLGATANQGTGYSDVLFRHDATTGTPGSGLALVSTGQFDTILNDHVLQVNGAESKIRLGNGEFVPMPVAGDSNYTNFAVYDSDGSELHVDFTAYTGADSSAVMHGEGSVAMPRGAYTALTFTETDMELVGQDGTVLHMDATGVTRSGNELASFTGATSIFDVLAGVAADLRNTSGLPAKDVVDRLSLRFGELEANFNRSLRALGTLGARTERLISSGSRLETVSLNVEGQLSQVEDVDITKVILEMNRTEQTLQLAQATGSRLIQHTLLDFLG